MESGDMELPAEWLAAARRWAGDWWRGERETRQRASTQQSREARETLRELRRKAWENSEFRAWELGVGCPQNDAVFFFFWITAIPSLEIWENDILYQT